MSLIQLRQDYHRRICHEIIRVSKRIKKQLGARDDYPNFADGSSQAST